MKEPDYCKRSLHMHHGLRTGGRKIGLCAVACPNLDERQIGVASGDGLEGKGGYASLSGDPGNVGRTGGGDGDEAVTLVPMDDGDCLAVATEEVSGVNVDELENSGVELELDWHGVDVMSVRERNRDLEGAANGWVRVSWNDREANGRASGGRWLGRILVWGRGGRLGSRGRPSGR